MANPFMGQFSKLYRVWFKVETGLYGHTISANKNIIGLSFNPIVLFALRNSAVLDKARTGLSKVILLEKFQRKVWAFSLDWARLCRNGRIVRLS